MRPCLRTAKERLGDGLIGVEVGVGLGDNASEILHCWRLEKLYLVDPYISYGDKNHEYQKHVKEEAAKKIVFFNAKWIYEESVIAANQFSDNSVDFVYIDAKHDYNSVSEDITAWFPKVKFGGIIGGHDFDSAEDNYGVMRAVTLWAAPRNIKIAFQDSDWWTVRL